MTTSTTPTTKTLDLATHAATFSSTYDHARRMGADRPLSHRFALADVLGEIETVIEKRVADAVDREKRVAETRARAARVRHEAEIERLRRISTAVGTTFRESAASSSRYVAEGGGIRDTVTGAVAPFGVASAARTYADRLNRGVTLRSELGWR